MISRYISRLICAATVAAAVCFTHVGCKTASPQRSGEASFSKSKVILEKNCVHCHGEIRLPQMPSLATSSSLADLIGPGKWIVPRKPDESRLFQVVTLNDDQAGAMPPTGHKISESEIATLRAWIQAGAKIPPGAPVTFTPKGTAPQSR